MITTYEEAKEVITGLRARVAELEAERDRLVTLLVDLDAAAFQFDAIAADMDRHLCDRREDACEWCDARDRLDVALVAVKRSGVAARRDALDVALGEGWVPVGKRLPGDSGWRLACTLSRRLVAHYADKTWTDAQEWPVDVTHWRNLPASPKE